MYTVQSKGWNNLRNNGTITIHWVLYLTTTQCKPQTKISNVGISERLAAILQMQCISLNPSPLAPLLVYFCLQLTQSFLPSMWISFMGEPLGWFSVQAKVTFNLTHGRWYLWHLICHLSYDLLLDSIVISHHSRDMIAYFPKNSRGYVTQTTPTTGRLSSHDY